MAIGRPDYWLRISPERALPGAGQEFISEYGIETVLLEDVKELNSYLVPTGYTFFITGVDVSCNLPGSKFANIFSLGAPVDTFTFYFDMQFNITRDWIAKFTSGQTVRLLVQNYESYDIIVTSTISGYLEEGFY